MGNHLEHATNRHFQISYWVPEYRNLLPENPTVKDEMHQVVFMFPYEDLLKDYEEIAKIRYGYFRLGLRFP